MSSDSSGDRTPRVFETLKHRSEANRQRDAAAPWREWLWERYARYWYGVGCLFLDVVVAGTVVQSGDGPTPTWQYAAAVALVIGLLFVEFKGYGWLWPRETLDT